MSFLVKKSLRILVYSTLMLFLISSIITTALADELEQQLQQTTEELNKAQEEKANTQTELERLESLKSELSGSLNYLENNLNLTSQQLEVTQASLEEKTTELEKTEKELQEIESQLNTRHLHLKSTVRTLYKTEQSSSPLIIQIAINEENDRFAMYQKSISKKSYSVITNLSNELKTITEIKELLASLKTELESQQAELAATQAYLQNNVLATQNQLSSTQNQASQMQQTLVGIDQRLSELTAQQQQILAAKAAAALASTTVGDVEVNIAALEKEPPQDGNVYFSFWTYGYPHRVGMNQYGAFGRAISGQSVDQILHAYYTGVEISDWDMPANITITTDGGDYTIPFEEDYLMGIGEMPSCWGTPDNGGLEALKAQAIAARTYAIKYTGNGSSPICTTQACQVYVGSSKTSGACGEYWAQAVSETRGRVLTYGGEPISAWYASTAGGFTLSSAQVWGGHQPYAMGIADVDGNGNPYDGPAHGNSPWYHKAWGNEPWLSFAQVADLFNAALLPAAYDNQINSLSSEEIVSILNDNGIPPISNLTALEVIDENGNPGSATAQIATVRAYHDDSMSTVTGSRFKFVFNLRSPGTDAIWTTRFDVITAAEL